MTQEEKAKAHDEALRKIRPLYERAKKEDCPIWSTYEYIFPELAENEDERIRKAILGLSYLDGIEPILTKCSVTRSDIRSYLEKQKKQKPAEWEDEYREEDLQTRFAFYTYKDEPDILYLSNLFVEELSRGAGFGTRILKAAEKVAETIGATSICVKVKQDSPANKWYRKNGYGYKTFEGEYDWLEKTLEYLKPNKPAGWSEEDDKMLLSIINAFRNGTVSTIGQEQWLKSLRSRSKTSSNWKPSEEQMEALKEASASWMNQEMGNCELLESLYNDLKKL